MGSGGDDESEMRFKHGENEPRVSRIEATSMPMYTKTDPFFSSTDWDPAVSAMVSSNAAGGFSSSHYPSLVMDSGFSHYPSGSGYADMSSSLLPYGNPPDCGGQIGHVLGSDKKSGCVGRLIRSGESQETHQISDDGVLGASPNRKRRQPEIDSVPSSQWNKKAVDKFNQNDVQKGSNVEDQRQKKPESEQNKESSQSGEAPKQDYIHVRARRGQATNSHSLAERVRREKISERMRLLQELVPGCNKITGKAVMLDEIINYVQSLQQQVEFLSMKLATVNPEINMDIDRIIAKDLMHSRDRNVSTLGLATGLNPSQYGVIQGTMQNIPATNPQYNPLSQTVLSSELQSLYQMGFVPNPSTMDSFSPNGRLKPEL